MKSLYTLNLRGNMIIFLIIIVSINWIQTATNKIQKKNEDILIPAVTTVIFNY